MLELETLSFWRRLVILRSIATDLVPGRLRAHEDMPLQRNTGISVHASESYAVNLAFMNATERRAANTAEI